MITGTEEFVQSVLPKMSGLEVQKQRQVMSPNTEVIVVTAREIPAIRVVALEGDAFAFLMKPRHRHCE